MLQGLTWAMLYLWTQNYSQIIGTCPGHHGQLISQNCVLTKIRAEPPIRPNPEFLIYMINAFTVVDKLYLFMIQTVTSTNNTRFYLLLRT